MCSRRNRQPRRRILKIAYRFLIFLSLLFCTILAVNAADTPKLLEAVPLSQTAIQLRFDEQLQAEAAENLDNYLIAPDVQLEYALLLSLIHI